MKNKPLILVADDSETFVMYLSVVLDRLNFDVITVDNGLDALNLAKTMKPDLVLLDIDMPKMSGSKVLQHIRENEKISDTPVIMLSILSKEKVFPDENELLYSGYLTKPVMIKQLNDILNNYVNYPNGRRRSFLRTDYNKKILLTFQETTNEHFAVNISEGGIFIRESYPLPVGSEVFLALPLKNDEHLRVKGVVIYIKSVYGQAYKSGPGMAIAFKDLSDSENALLRGYITELITEGLPDHEAVKRDTPMS